LFVREWGMKLEVTAVPDSIVYVRYADDNEGIWFSVQIPRSELKGPRKKLSMFAQADVDWGFKKPPPPKAFEELTPAEIRTAALDYVQRVLRRKP